MFVLYMYIWSIVSINRLVIRLNMELCLLLYSECELMAFACLRNKEHLCSALICDVQLLMCDRSFLIFLDMYCFCPIAFMIDLKRFGI